MHSHDNTHSVSQEQAVPRREYPLRCCTSCRRADFVRDDASAGGRWSARIPYERTRNLSPGKAMEYLTCLFGDDLEDLSTKYNEDKQSRGS